MDLLLKAAVWGRGGGGGVPVKSKVQLKAQHLDNVVTTCKK